MIKSYKEMTIDKYLQLKKIDITGEEIDIQTEMIAILSDKTLDEVLDMPLQEYMACVQNLQFLLETPRETPCPKKIVLGDREYYVMRDVRDMTTAQYIDYQMYIQNGGDDNLPNIISCFVIPKGKTYNKDYDIAEAIEDIKTKLSIETAFSISRFFFRKLENSTKAMLLYLESKIKRILKRKDLTEETRTKMEEALSAVSTQNDGVGFQVLIELLKL